MLLEQFDSFWGRETGIPHTQLSEVEQAMSLPYAVIVSGLRRAGKSTLLMQLAHCLGQDQFSYVNFADDRFLGFQAEESNDLFQTLVEVFGERKVFITGSNASLLSKELGTRLTGRYVPIELFPFSFREYLELRGEALPDLGHMTTVEKARLQTALQSYLQSGGLPEALKYLELPLLRTLYTDSLGNSSRGTALPSAENQRKVAVLIPDEINSGDDKHRRADTVNIWQYPM